MKLRSLLTGYDPQEELPLGGYTTLVAVFGAGMAATLFQLRNRGGGRRWSSRDGGAKDVVLLGMATYQLTRIIAKDRVLAGLRAPFTRYEGSAGAGELKESARGSGLQKAIGDLLTCPYCLAPWVAGALSVGLLKQPEATRWLTRLFAAVAISDTAQQGYAALKKLSD